MDTIKKIWDNPVAKKAIMGLGIFILVILIIIIVKVNNTPRVFIIFKPLIGIIPPSKNDKTENIINIKLINKIIILYTLYLFLYFARVLFIFNSEKVLYSNILRLELSTKVRILLLFVI